jgi:acetoacetate decarboxylase
MTVFARCSSDGIAALTPSPLRPWHHPIVRFTVNDLTCDLGFGWEWAQANPARSCFREAVIGLAAEHDGHIGFWDPFLWTDSDAEFAVGREMYGWPQRLGNIVVTQAHTLRGWQAGDVAAAEVSRLGAMAFAIAIRLERQGRSDAPQPPFEGFFLERILPDPTDGSRLREMFFAQMTNVAMADFHSGVGTLALHAPELAAFGTPEVIGGHLHAIGWTKNRAVRLASERLE